MCSRCQLVQSHCDWVSVVTVVNVATWNRSSSRLYKINIDEKDAFWQRLLRIGNKQYYAAPPLPTCDIESEKKRNAKGGYVYIGNELIHVFRFMPGFIFSEISPWLKIVYEVVSYQYWTNTREFCCIRSYLDSKTASTIANCHLIHSESSNLTTVTLSTTIFLNLKWIASSRFRSSELSYTQCGLVRQISSYHTHPQISAPA